MFVVDLGGGVCDEMWLIVFFQAEDGIRDLVRSRGLGDVYKRQPLACPWLSLIDLKWSMSTITADSELFAGFASSQAVSNILKKLRRLTQPVSACLLYTSDAADERSSVDLGGRRIIKKQIKKKKERHKWVKQKRMKNTNNEI